MTPTPSITAGAGESEADDLLRSGYDRWLRLEADKAAIADDLKELFAELKGNGLDPKALRVSFRLVRDIDDADKQEQDALVDLYVASLVGARPARHAREIIEEFPPEPSREERRKQRFSESMEDAKALSAEAAALGLIDPAAHAETARLSDAWPENQDYRPFEEESAISPQPFAVGLAGAAAPVDIQESGEGGALPVSATAELPTIKPETANEYPQPDAHGQRDEDRQGAAVEVRDTTDGQANAGGTHDRPPVSSTIATATPALGSEGQRAGAVALGSDVEPVAPIPDAADPGKSAEAQATAAPGRRAWKFNDPAHIDCLRPEQCGGFSNHGLCADCKLEALSARQVA